MDEVFTEYSSQVQVVYAFARYWVRNYNLPPLDTELESIINLPPLDTELESIIYLPPLDTEFKLLSASDRYRVRKYNLSPIDTDS